MTAVATSTTRPHGYARYRLDGCRCYACAWARSQYDENRTKQLAAGTWKPWADATPVRTHLARLAGAGIGERRVHELTGVSRTAISAVLRGRRGNPPGARVRTETAAAILALAPDPAGASPGAVIDGFGTSRRIQALCCLGWTLTEQAERIGWTLQNYLGLTSCAPVVVRTALLVRGLYERLSMSPAPDGPAAGRARAMAARKGWVPPLAWDDEDIDNPAALPATTPGDAAGQQLLRAWLTYAYLPLKEQGRTREETAAQLGMSVHAVKARLGRAREAGLYDEPRPARLALQPCGTYAALVRHRRRGEPVDEACAVAGRSWKTQNQSARRTR